MVLHLETEVYLVGSDPGDGQFWNFVLGKKICGTGFHCGCRLPALEAASDKKLVNVVGEWGLMSVLRAVEYGKQAFGFGAEA